MIVILGVFAVWIVGIVLLSLIVDYVTLLAGVISGIVLVGILAWLTIVFVQAYRRHQ